jgi:hypothetical protein
MQTRYQAIIHSQSICVLGRSLTNILGNLGLCQAAPIHLLDVKVVTNGGVETPRDLSFNVHLKSDEQYHISPLEITPAVDLMEYTRSLQRTP